jgi:hypothetical protein
MAVARGAGVLERTQRGSNPGRSHRSLKLRDRRRGRCPGREPLGGGPSEGQGVASTRRRHGFLWERGPPSAATFPERRARRGIVLGAAIGRHGGLGPRPLSGPTKLLRGRRRSLQEPIKDPVSSLRSSWPGSSLAVPSIPSGPGQGEPRPMEKAGVSPGSQAPPAPWTAGGSRPKHASPRGGGERILLCGMVIY